MHQLLVRHWSKRWANSNSLFVSKHLAIGFDHDDRPAFRCLLCASQCTAVCRLRCPSTRSTVALQSQTLLVDATYARPVDITCLYHVVGSVSSVVEPSLLQARRSGTLYWTVSETWLSVAAASGNYLRWISSTVTQHTQRSRD